MSAFRVLKRSIDLLVSGFLLVILAPLWLVIVIAVKLDSSGPVLFVQKAVGLHKREFMLLKFRSMRSSSEDAVDRQDVLRNIRQKTPTAFDARGLPVFKTAVADANRITRTGRLLRRTSLDELPQMWNVLMGDMSLVGPRPSLPREVELYDGWEQERFEVKPGITGLYQVTARNRVPIEEMIRIDIEYVRKSSFWLDLKLMARTPAAMCNGM